MMDSEKPFDDPRWTNADTLFSKPLAKQRWCEDNVGRLLDNQSPRGFRQLFGQYHQDWVVASLFLTTKLWRTSSAFYLEVGSNDAIKGSNTFFLDACLGWRGVCVEPNDQDYAWGIRRRRTCRHVKACVANETTSTDFFFAGSSGRIVRGDMRSQRALLRNSHLIRKASCSPLRVLLAAEHAAAAAASSSSSLLPAAPPPLPLPLPASKRRRGRLHVAFLSLDVEGAELEALASMDWASTTVDVALVERASRAVASFLASVAGMVPALCVAEDALFVRSDRAALIRSWHLAHVYTAPGCLTNDTEQCIGSRANLLACRGAMARRGT
jgi:hypothetical protein